MEQRAEVRFDLKQTVQLTVLSANEFRATARIRNVSRKGVQLELEQTVPAGTPVKIDIDNALVLGEVVYCRPQGPSCLIGIKLEQVLNGLAELHRKLQEFAGEWPQVENLASR